VPTRSRPHDPFVASIRLVLDVARRRRFQAALIGGFALSFHRVQRATGDVDFLAAEDGADALDDALRASGARRLYRSTDAANYAPGSSGWRPSTSSMPVVHARATCSDAPDDERSATVFACRSSTSRR
jgi:hypothetical protein